MNAKIKGNNALVWSIARQYLFTFWGIAALTILIYVIIAFIFGSTQEASSSRLILTMFIQTIWGAAIFAALPYATSFKYAIGFGSTRVAFWRTYIKFGYLIILINTLFLILASLVVIFLYSTFSFVQDVTVFSTDSLFYMFTFIMVNSFFFGCILLITVFWFQQGFFKVAVIFIGLGLLTTVGLLTNIIPTLVEFNLIPIISISGVLGFAFTFLGYQMAKNGPLTYMNR